MRPRTPRRLLAPALLALALLAQACAPGALIMLNPRYDPQKIQRVAMVDFEDHPSMVGSGKIVSGIFEKYLFLGSYGMVDRQQVAAALASRNLQSTDNLDLFEMRTLADKLGVDALIFGQVTDFTDTSEKTVVEDMALEQSSPLVSRVETIQSGPNGTVKTRQDVLTGYATSTVDTPIQQTETVEAHVGLTLRMVDARTGEVLWSASASAMGPHLNDASEAVSARIIHALSERLKDAKT
jgi:PBP1b-binding outer membrane lipoprotein LpoB